MKKALSLALTLMLAGTAAGAVIEASAAEDGTFTMAWNYEITDFCPWNTYSDCDLMAQVYETLVRYNTDGDMIGALAESWDVSEDGMTYVFHLREDAKFSNGDPVTAEDVVYTFEMVAGSAGTSGMNYGTESWEEIDEKTVQLNMATPHEPVLSQLAIPSNSIANKGVVEQYGYDWPREAIEGTGSGAFRFTEYIPGDRLVLEPNEYYWGGESDIQRIEWRFIADPTAASAALQNGEIDFFNYVPTLEVSILEAVDGITVEGKENVGMIYIYCNVDENNQSSPIANKQVRQAITYAIDRDVLLMLGCEGDGYTTSTLIPTPFNGYDASYEIARDVDKAKELMAEAGYADGCELTLTYSPDKHIAFGPIAEGLQAQLAEIGITLTLKTCDSGTADSLAWAHEYGDMGLNVIYAAVEDPQYVQYYSIGSLELGTLNFSGYSNPELDELMSQSRQASGEEQAELVKQTTEVAMDEAICISICNGGKNRYAYRSDRWWTQQNWNDRFYMQDWKRAE